ncbi:MAG: hypothetical protein Q9187_008094, partial [Circinaria calcarea]
AQYGLGRHLNTLTPQMLVKEGQVHLLLRFLPALISHSCLQVFYASELIWAASITIIKISILLFYTRLFGRLRYIRLWAYWLSVFSVCWGIMVILGCSFQCRPLRFIWDKSVNGTCMNVALFFILGSAPNVLTDFMVLVLPLPAVFALQTSRGQKISLAAIFMLGSITCIISLVRLIELILNARNSDPTCTFSSDFPPFKLTNSFANPASPSPTGSLSIVGILSTAEACLGIVAACLPTLRPLFIKMLAQKKRVGSNGSDSADLPRHGRPQILRLDDGSDGFQTLYPARMETKITTVAREEKKGARVGMGMGGTQGIPLNAIGVSTTTILVK